MADETALPAAPWFVVRLRALVHALLYDEAAAKRYAVMGLGAVGALVKSGGVVPGTTVVVPIPAWLAPRGDLILLASLWLATGGKINKTPGAQPRAE